MHGHGDLGRKQALTEPAEDPGSSGLPRCFDDLERRVIGVRGEHERALRRARRDARVQLPELVGLRRNPSALELLADRVERGPLVVGSGRGQRDALKDGEDLVGID